MVAQWSRGAAVPVPAWPHARRSRAEHHPSRCGRRRRAAAAAPGAAAHPDAETCRTTATGRVRLTPS